MWTFGTFCQLLVKYLANLMTQFYKLGESRRTLSTKMVSMGRFIQELWPRGRLHWQIKKNFSDTFYNCLQRLTTVLQMFTTVLQTLATICGKINSQINFACSNFLCDKKNCLRTCLRPLTNPDEKLANPNFATFASVRRSVWYPLNEVWHFTKFDELVNLLKIIVVMSRTIVNDSQMHHSFRSYI